MEDNNQVSEPRIAYIKCGNDIEGTVAKGKLRTIFNFTKARIAESLIMELFTTEGYLVRRNGFEHVYEGLHQQLAGSNEPTTLRMRKSPDLVVVNPTNNKSNYLEVKFSFSTYFKPDKKDLETMFPGCYYAIVTPDRFYAIKQEELGDSSLVFAEANDFELSKVNHFDLRQDSIQKFEEMASYFYSDHLKSGNDRYR